MKGNAISNIPEARLSKLRSLIGLNNENIFVACDLKKLHIHGGSASRIVIVTTTSVYVCKASMTSSKVADRFFVTDVIKISFIQPDTIILTFKSKQLVLKSDFAKEIGTIVMHQRELFYYLIPESLPLRVESTPVEALQYKAHSRRPSSLLQTRIFIIAAQSDRNVPVSSIRYFKQWDASPNGKLTLNEDLCISHTLPILSAVIMDADLKHLELHTFSPHNLGPYVSLIFKHSFSITRLSLRGYSSKSNLNFDLAPGQYCSINSLSFNNVSSSVIAAVFRSLHSFNGRILTLGFERVNLSSSKFRTVIDNILNLNCFLALRSIHFNDIDIHDIPMEGLKTLMSSLGSLVSITFENIEDDLTDILCSILKSSSRLQIIRVISSKLTKEVPEMIRIPESLVTFDMNHTNVTERFFTSMMTALLGRRRRRPISVEASYLKTVISTADLFRRLNERPLEAVLVELNWNGNPVDLEAFYEMSQFLRKQTNFNYLSFSFCIVSDHKEILNELSQLIVNGNIKGLELANYALPQVKEFTRDFLGQLGDAKSLISLSLPDCPIGDEGGLILLDMVKRLPNLVELSVDNIAFESEDVFCRVFNELCEIDTLKAIAPPKRELAAFSINKSFGGVEGNRMIRNLKVKKTPSNAYTRQQEYLRMILDSALLEGEEANALNSHSSTSAADGHGMRVNPLEELSCVMANVLKCFSGEADLHQSGLADLMTDIRESRIGRMY